MSRELSPNLIRRARAILIHARIAFEQLAKVDEHAAKLLGRGLVAQPEHGLDQHLIPPREADDRQLGQSGVRNVRERAVVPANPRRANAHPLDGPQRVAVLAVLAVADGLVGDEADAGDQILDRRLRGQRDRQPAHTQPCDDPVQRHSHSIGAEGKPKTPKRVLIVLFDQMRPE